MKRKKEIPEDIFDILQKNIKQLRAQKNWSQAVLAAEAGISTSYIAEVEIKRKKPSLSTISQIASALGVKTYQLLKDPALSKDEVIADYTEKVKIRMNKVLDELKDEY